METVPAEAGNNPALNPPACACGSWWRLPMLLALVLAAILVFDAGSVREDAPRLSDSAQRKMDGKTDAERVRLTIVFGDGRRQLLDNVDWREGMTVRDLMQSAPRVSYLQQGRGASAFLTSINGVGNEGVGGRNWIYSVNGERGDRSYAVYELQPGDRVLWTFAAQ